jgi:hypothetical protein
MKILIPQKVDHGESSPPSLLLLLPEYELVLSFDRS